MRYRAAVIGCGRIGVRMDEDPKQPRPATHAGACAASERITLEALVDSDPEQIARAASRFPRTRTFADCQDMLGTVRPDLVAVATPPETHRRLVEQCAAAGVRAIVCEKPIALDPEDARRMVDACAAAGALLFVNHTRRFDPLIRRAREEVSAGGIGEVLQATCLYTAGVLNTGTHLVDLLRFFLGDAIWAIGVPNGRGWCPEKDEGVDGLIEFRSGARAVMQFLNKDDYNIFDVRLYGRRGSMALTRFGFQIEQVGLAPREDVSGLMELDLGRATREGTPRSLMGAMVTHVVDCLDGRDRPVSRGEDGLAALELVLALRQSAARGSLPVSVGSAEGSA